MSSMKDLLGDTPYPAPSNSFGGATFDPERDYERLGAQLKRVLTVMQSGDWMTLREIARETGDPETSISSRIRDFRKEKFGAHTIEAEYVRRGLWRYRLRKAA
jgi:hypothetical protein